MRSLTSNVLVGLLAICVPAQDDLYEWRNPLLLIKHKTQVDLAELSRLINQYIGVTSV
jgi:hypothetical protein